MFYILYPFLILAYYDALKLTVDLHNVSVRDFANGMMVEDSTGLSNNLLTKLLFDKDLLESYDHKKAIPAYFDVSLSGKKLYLFVKFFIFS